MYHTWDMFKLKYICLWLIKLFVLFRVQHDKRSSFLEIYEDRLVTHKIGTYVRRYWTHSKVRDSVYLNPSTKLLWKWISIFSFIMHPYRQFIPIQHAPKQIVHPNYMLIFFAWHTLSNAWRNCVRIFPKGTRAWFLVELFTTPFQIHR